MGRSFGLAAYRALSRRSAQRAFTPSGPRQGDELVWLHAAEPENITAVQDLAQRMCAARYGAHVLITLPDQASLEACKEAFAPLNTIHFDVTPSEHPDAVEAFLKHWSPELCIWVFGRLRPNLILATHERGCPMALIDADTSGFDGRRDRWLPELSRRLLSQFVTIIARSGAALRRLETLGVASAKIELTPPLQAGGQALPCEDSDLADMSLTLAGRPVWLATGVRKNEIPTVLLAHRMALRLSHRLLLILNPSSPELDDDIREKAASDGFRMCEWPDTSTLDDSTQILLASDNEDLGLFYRVAPVSFLGSSLLAGHGGRNPFEAAALGSAILYGPNIRYYLPFYTRLANAGAARIINDAQTLGMAVTRLIAPDQAAAMAHAGWDVISQGAAVTDRMIDLMHTTLDGEERHDDAGA